MATSYKVSHWFNQFVQNHYFIQEQKLSLMCKSLNYSLKLFHTHWFIKEFLLLIWTHLPYILFMIMTGSHITFSSSPVCHWAFYLIWATVMSIIIQKLPKFTFFVLKKVIMLISFPHFYFDLILLLFKLLVEL